MIQRCGRSQLYCPMHAFLLAFPRHRPGSLVCSKRSAISAVLSCDRVVTTAFQLRDA